MSDTGPKLHHYVPQMELNYFATDDLLWVYDRKTKTYRQQPPKYTAAETNFYTFKLDTGETTKDVENALAHVEGIAAEIIRKINKGYYEQTPEERSELATYLAVRWMRTPTHQQRTEAMFEATVKTEMLTLANDEARFNEIIDQLESAGTLKGVDRSEMLKFMSNDNKYKIDTTRETSMQSMLLNLKEISEVIYNMTWFFCYASKGRAFLTSDNPFFVRSFRDLGNPLAHGLLSPYSITISPLTPNLCLILMPGDKPRSTQKSLPLRMMNDTNDQIALFSRRFVISHNENLIHKVVERTKLFETDPYKITVTVLNEPLAKIMHVTK